MKKSAHNYDKMSELQSAFASSYDKILNALRPLKLGSDIVFETCVFLLFLSLPRTEEQMALKEDTAKEIIPFILRESGQCKTDFLKTRLDLYVGISSGKIKPKGESLGFRLPEDMDPNLSVLVAYSDLLFNPKRETDYENAHPLMTGIDLLYGRDFIEKFNSVFHHHVVPPVDEFIIFINKWYTAHTEKQHKQNNTNQSHSAKSLYDILQISRNASPEIIKAAYLALAKKYHPDTYVGDKGYAEKMMKSINEAYSVLSSPDKKCEYDRKSSEQVPMHTSNHGNTAAHSPKNDDERSPGSKHLKSDRASVVLFLSVIVLFAGFTVWSLIDSNSNNTPIETTFSNPPKSSASTTPQEPKTVTEPNTGYIFEGGWDDGSELTITAPYNASVVVKAKNIYGSTEICFYVQAGDTVTMDVPAEDLQIFFASGSKWYGYDDLFGLFTSYSKDDSYLDFGEYTWSYTLQPVTDGNFSETPSNKSEFME